MRGWQVIGMNEFQNPFSKAVLTEAELADSLGLSPWTVRRWRLSEGLPVIQVGRRYRYKRDSVLKWLESRESNRAVAEDASETGVIRRVQP